MKYTNLLTAAVTDEDQNIPINNMEGMNQFLEMIDELNQLCSALDARSVFKQNICCFKISTVHSQLLIL